MAHGAGKLVEPPSETEVLVAGGGPTGLATALELARRGVDCVVVEPRVAVSHHRPRAKTTSVRTMEHLRRWGIAERLRAAAYLPVAWSQDIVFCANLLGPEITRFEHCFELTTERDERFAETSQQVPQPIVEEVLRETLSELGTCRLALGWRVDSVVERTSGVRVGLTEPGGSRAELDAGYVVGCEGAGSVTRASIGARYVGAEDVRRNLTLVFRAPGLAERVPHGPAIQYWVLQPGASAYMGRLDLDETWWIGLIGLAKDCDEAEALALLRSSVGGQLEATLVSSDPWVARMLNADRYGSERVLLAGDAAHLNPPWGGHGFNTGIGDAVNAAWKLAARLQGWGGPELLGSYDAERRPVAERTVEVAGRHAGLLAADYADPLLAERSGAGRAARERAAADIQRAKYEEFHSLGLVLGYEYGESPVVVGDGTPADPVTVSEYLPTARPGARLPHAWLGPETSLYDLLGGGFTMLRLGDADPAPFERAAKDRGLPLEVLDVRGVPALAALCAAPLVLVRPDQHVAWRGPEATDPAAVLDRVRGAGQASRRTSVQHPAPSSTTV